MLAGVTVAVADQDADDLGRTLTPEMTGEEYAIVNPALEGLMSDPPA